MVDDTLKVDVDHEDKVNGGGDPRDDQAESMMVYRRDPGGLYGVFELRYPPTQ